MNILLPTSLKEQPFSWLDTNYLPDSVSERIEIYLGEEEGGSSALLLMFNRLFYELSDDLLIYNKSWWAFCIDTWDINSNQFIFETEAFSNETKSYLRLLRNSNLDKDFEGCCKCTNWDLFLSIVLECLLKHIAPYSPLFLNLGEEFAFYFHHSGSIGLYYKSENPVVERIVTRASALYDIKRF